MVLRLTCRGLAPGWIELRDANGRIERGSLHYIGHHVRKWSTEAFIAACGDLVWVHAAAVARDRGVLLLIGPAGAGKSSLAVQLVQAGWRLLADDATPIHPTRLTALPLPFNPDFRQRPSGGAAELLQQPKTLVALRSDQVSLEAASVEAMVFPTFAECGPVSLCRLPAVTTAETLLAHCLHFGANKPRAVGALFQLAEMVPAWHVTYHDPAPAAVELNDL
jgi:hypothetical protein